MIRVSAPGKTILMGEHAAVYGRPALVAAVDRRCHVALEPLGDGASGGLDLDLPQVAVHERIDAGALRAYATRFRLAWQRSEQEPSSSDREALKAPDRGHVVRLAAGEALEALAAHGVALDGSWRLRLTSELPIGSGFGSSAAVAVAVIRALWQACDPNQSEDLYAETLHAISLEVERRQHGSPSGVDNATVIHGGVVWVEREGAGKLRVEPLDVAGSPILANLRIVQTGEPAESTGEVVAAVRDLRLRDVDAFERRLDDMAACTERFRSLLAEPSPDPGVGIDLIRSYEAALEACGVVPVPVRDAIRAIEAEGGAAKISGAGSVAGPGAGSLLVYHPQPAVLEEITALDVFERLDVSLGAPGAL